MSNQFASDRKVIAECDVCGFQYRLRELRSLIVKGRDTNVKACIECWNPDHPQLKLGMYPVNDPQAIRNPRPDYAGYAQSRAQIIPVTQTVGTMFMGQVTVTIS
tara:strand:- start:103 stop:414 length:312 start_codon:yes stop_codon:yes gene_type:complete